MCGIVGLFLKNERLEPELGQHLSRMLATLSTRGPDSAGVAIYGAGSDSLIKLTFRAAEAALDRDLAKDIGAALQAPVDLVRRSNHVVVTIPRERQPQALAWLRDHRPDMRLISAGSRMEIYKDVGLSEARRRPVLAARDARSTHGVGHTRMATESAVTTDRAHPFSTGADQCLVHNGSLSNHNAVQRGLKREGFAFETENDSEVAVGIMRSAPQTKYGG